MIKKLSALGLLMLFFSFPAAAGDPDDNDIFFKFVLYTQKVYLTRDLENLDASDFSLTMVGKLFSARVLGYSLGNLLQYARRGSENHKIWLMLEKKVQEAMFGLIDREGAEKGWDSAFIQKRKQNALAQFQGAQQGWFGPMLVTQTGVTEKDAPNFFETLAVVPPALADSPITTEQPVPPVEQPVPPAPASEDAVAGTYRVTGKKYYDDNPGASLIRLSGSMNEVEAEFKLFDGAKVTWDYKGTATWDGKTWNTSEKTVRTLTGKTQWVTSPHIFHGLTLGLALGDDGRWRADSINIGGNLFMLKPVRAVGQRLPAQSKTLTIRNTTAVGITVYLDGGPGYPKTTLGSVEAHSESTLSGIPERGRWYISIDPPPGLNLKSHSFTLYVKEAEYAYFYEVTEQHFR